MSLVEWVDLKPISDSRGSLVAIEGGRTVPFDIRRVYYLYGLDPALPRGFHAHRELRQVAICLAGRCRLILDDGAQRQDAVLDRPDRGLLIDRMVWHEMSDFSDDCVLMVLASDHYDEADYIRDHDTFLTAVEQS